MTLHDLHLAIEGLRLAWWLVQTPAFRDLVRWNLKAQKKAVLFVLGRGSR